MIKIDIFQDDRYIGRLRIKDRWLGIIPINEEEVKQEVESRLPTLRKANYNIVFA